MFIYILRRVCCQICRNQLQDLERFSGCIYIGVEASGSMAEEHQQDATYVRSCYEMEDPDLSAPHKLAQPLN